MSDSHRRSGRSASKLRSTRSAGRAASSSGMVVRLVSPLTRIWRVFCVLPGQRGFGGGVFPLHGRCGGLVVGLGDGGFVPGAGVCSDGGEGSVL